MEDVIAEGIGPAHSADQRAAQAGEVPGIACSRFAEHLARAAICRRTVRTGRPARAVGRAEIVIERRISRGAPQVGRQRVAGREGLHLRRGLEDVEIGAVRGKSRRDLPHIAVEIGHAAILPVVRRARKQVGATGLGGIAIAVRGVEDRGILRIAERIIVAALGEVVGRVVPGAIRGAATGRRMGIRQHRQRGEDEAAIAEEVCAARLGRCDRAVIIVRWSPVQSGEWIVHGGARERVTQFDRTSDTGVVARQVLVNKDALLHYPAIVECPMQRIAGGVSGGDVWIVIDRFHINSVDRQSV